MRFCLIVSICLLSVTWANADISLVPQSVLLQEDRSRLENVLKLTETSVDEQNVANIHQKLAGLNVLYAGNLNAPVTSDLKQKFCDNAIQLLKSDLTKGSIETIYHSTSIVQLLNCPRPNSADVVSVLESVHKADSSIDDLFRSSISLINLGKKPQAQKLVQLLQNALQKNDSVLAHGLALQLVSKLASPEATGPFVKRIADIVAQADLVDSRLLQFEGGLGVTANVLIGIYSLANAINKPVDVSSEQTIKFTNYLISRRTVQTVKGASELLQTLNLLSNNKFHVPVLIAPGEGSIQISSNKPVFTLKVVNALGLALNRQFAVTLIKSDETSKTFVMDPVQGDSTLYAVNIYGQSKLPAGVHDFNIKIKPLKAESQIVLPIENQVSLIVQDEITLEDVEVAVGEKDQLSLRYQPVKYPARHAHILDVDHTQKIGVTFRVQNVRTSKNILPQQAFLQFRRKSDSKQITYLADFERSSSTYRSVINMVTRSKDFDYEAGSYDLFILIGDSSASNSIVYHLAEILLDLPTELAPQVHIKPWLRQELTPLPELQHTFRPAEKRPPEIVSQMFTFFAFLPLLLLLVVWYRIGVNLQAFKFACSAILFHSSLLLIFVLYALFFWYMDMFTTVKCLSGILVLAFLSGHRLLSNLAKPVSKAD